MTTANKNGRELVTRDARGRFMPGSIPNPKGRPPSAFSFTELLRVEVSKRPRLIEKLCDLAESEDENVALRAILGIANRIDGMPRQSVEVENVNEPPAVQALRELQQELRNGHAGG